MRFSFYSAWLLRLPFLKNPSLNIGMNQTSN
ncbi:hypothetical protein Zm00014a_034574 [Zea mays]|uniref:Uncharacterized protein n=1 Tax=Zea mays TaxID=4577 RepID=A0A3L6FDU5_MAIZE|nr:hypothetical protein Zm00014a_034574 [Zea mays]